MNTTGPQTLAARRMRCTAIDVRYIALATAAGLQPHQGNPGARAREAFERGIEAGMLLRFMGDVIALAPPFIAKEGGVRHMIEALRGVLRQTA